MFAGGGRRQDEDRARHGQETTGAHATFGSMDRLRVLWLIKGLGPGGAEQLLVSMAGVRDRTAADVDVAYLLPWKDAFDTDSSSWASE